MSRLPIPGSDDGTWGDILNDYLSQSLNADGTIKPAAITSAGGASDSTVVHNTTDETIAGVKTFSSSPIVPTPTTATQAANKSYVDASVSAGAPDATTTNKGLVQLAGDLSGTATAPTVPGLASKVPTSRLVSTGSGLSGGGDLSADRTLSIDTAVVATLTGAQTLTNKTITDSTNNVTARSLKSATTTVDVSAATAPTSGQVLTATAGTTATWQTPTAAPVSSVFGRTGAVTAQSGDYTFSQVGAAQGLVSTSVKTTNYTAAAGDFVPVDTTSGNVTVTLPTAPADRTRIGAKMVIQGGTNSTTIATAGSDVFNVAAGATTRNLPLLNQAILLQYTASSGIWYVQADDLPLVALDGRYATSGANSNITSLTGLTTPLSVAQGGSGANTLTGIVKGNGTSAMTTVTAPTGAIVGTTDTQTLTNKTLVQSIQQGAAVIPLTDGATINTDASLGNIFTVTLGGNRTIANPTNPTSGQRLIYRLKQDATGTRTITWGAAFRFGTDIPTPTLTATALKTDYLGFLYNAADTTWDCVALSRGY